MPAFKLTLLRYNIFKTLNLYRTLKKHVNYNAQLINSRKFKSNFSINKKIKSANEEV